MDRKFIFNFTLFALFFVLTFCVFSVNATESSDTLFFSKKRCIKYFDCHSREKCFKRKVCRNSRDDDQGIRIPGFGDDTRKRGGYRGCVDRCALEPGLPLYSVCRKRCSKANGYDDAEADNNCNCSHCRGSAWCLADCYTKCRQSRNNDDDQNKYKCFGGCSRYAGNPAKHKACFDRCKSKYGSDDDEFCGVFMNCGPSRTWGGGRGKKRRWDDDKGPSRYGLWDDDVTEKCDSETNCRLGVCIPAANGESVCVEHAGRTGGSGIRQCLSGVCPSGEKCVGYVCRKKTEKRYPEDFDDDTSQRCSAHYQCKKGWFCGRGGWCYFKGGKSGGNYLDDDKMYELHGPDQRLIEPLAPVADDDVPSNNDKFSLLPKRCRTTKDCFKHQICHRILGLCARAPNPGVGAVCLKDSHCGYAGKCKNFRCVRRNDPKCGPGGSCEEGRKCDVLDRCRKIKSDDDDENKYKCFGGCSGYAGDPVKHKACFDRCKAKYGADDDKRRHSFPSGKFGRTGNGFFRQYYDDDTINCDRKQCMHSCGYFKKSVSECLSICSKCRINDGIGRKCNQYYSCSKHLTCKEGKCVRYYATPPCNKQECLNKCADKSNSAYGCYMICQGCNNDDDDAFFYTPRQMEIRRRRELKSYNKEIIMRDFERNLKRGKYKKTYGWNNDQMYGSYGWGQRLVRKGDDQ